MTQVSWESSASSPDLKRAVHSVRAPRAGLCNMFWLFVAYCLHSHINKMKRRKSAKLPLDDKSSQRDFPQQHVQRPA
ncbi:hypothetical protein AMECASPLE_019995 [Ameca splendens]|uniref:Uncharacterized protein n=1 Tax=Ameca splendens TaxID=208324 RepID=A0ABV0ZQ37_9TELE